MTVQFTKATKTKRKARIALLGATGAGKTYTALEIARGLVGPDGRIAVIDTEHGSASLYSDRHGFDVLELQSFAPERYIEAVKAAGAAGYDALIIDSWSHAWAGKDGVLEFVDAQAKRSQSGNKYNAWGDATPKQNDMVETILTSPCHVIATMRSKMAHVQEKNERTGKTEIRKVGMQPIQRDGVEYEFDIVADMTLDNDLVVSKTRYSAMRGRIVRQPTPELGEEIAAWLDDGAEAPPPKVRFEVRGKQYETAGITKETLLAVWAKSAAVDKARTKGAAKDCVEAQTGKTSSVDLTEDEGVAVCAALDALLAGGEDGAQPAA